ncbi:hypothetical protein JCM5350_000673 [Sporobolomyces pararoseus]
MTLPDELINHIFEYVYTSLCHHAAQRELDFPIGSKFVYSNFSLVSKTWHSLSLPFLVRHFDGQNVEAFTKFVETYKLFKYIKSIYLDPKIKGWPHPDKFEEICRDSVVPAYNCGEAAMREHDEDVRREVKRWSSLLVRAVPTLSMMEIGSRRRDKLERGPWYGDWHHRSGDYEEDGYGRWRETAPALDLNEFLVKVPVSLRVHSLRLNLPDEVGPEYEYGDVDAQFASTISSRFPNLKHYTLHSHSQVEMTKRLYSEQSPPLRSLRILNVTSDSLGLSDNLRPTYLLPSVATLCYLELQIIRLRGFITVRDLFGPLNFPLLEEFHLDSEDLSCTQSNFFDRFLRIESASLPLQPGNISLVTLPVLPVSLRRLTLSRLEDSSLVHLAQYLRREDLSQLTRLVLQSKSNTMDEAPRSSLPRFETSESPTTELATIIRICSRNQVEVCYSMALSDEGIDLDAPEDLSEDENWDFDGEDGDDFRKLWSIDKKRSHDIDEGFKKFRYWIQNDEAESRAKDCLKPFLR